MSMQAGSWIFLYKSCMHAADLFTQVYFSSIYGTKTRAIPIDSYYDRLAAGSLILIFD